MTRAERHRPWFAGHRVHSLPGPEAAMSGRIREPVFGGFCLLGSLWVPLATLGCPPVPVQVLWAGPPRDPPAFGSASPAAHTAPFLKPHSLPSISGQVLRLSGTANHCDNMSVIHVTPSLPSSLLSFCRALLSFLCFVREMAFTLSRAGLAIQGPGTCQKRFLIYN